MTAPQKRVTLPSAVGQNRRRIEILEATSMSGDMSSGWTVTTRFDEPLTLDFSVVIPIPRVFSGWLLFDVDASLWGASTSGDVEIGMDRIRSDGVSTTSITAIL
jgi:hypothetical protein